MEYKIYALKDPTDNLIKYVGVSKNVDIRYKQHYYSKDVRDNNLWIADLKSKNLKPELIILETLDSDDRNVALNRERFYIDQYKGTIWNIDGTGKERGKTKNKYTTICIDTEIKSELDKAMIETGKKMTYNEILQYLIDFYNEANEEDDFVQRMMDGDMIDDGPETFDF